MAILTEKFTGNLASSAVSEEFTFNYDVQIKGVEVVANGNITETVSVIHRLADGTQFIREAKNLAAEADFGYFPVGTVIVKKGDKVKVTITNANTTGTIIRLVTVESL